MISAFVLTVALSTPMTPPCEVVVNHAHPAHCAQPTSRIFERRVEDQDRRAAWLAYSSELDLLWADYRAAGSTPAAFRKYLAAAGQAKRRYVFADPYLAPIAE